MRGEGVHCAGIIFLTGLCEKETEAGRVVFFWKHETPSPRRSRRPNTKDVAMQANSYRASFRSIKMCYLTHGLEGLDVDFFLHENKVLRSDSDVAGVQMHHLSKRAPWVSCPPSDAFISYRIIMYFTAGVAGVFSALHRMWKPWCKQKKSVGSRFDAESAPLGGELS